MEPALRRALAFFKWLPSIPRRLWMLTRQALLHPLLRLSLIQWRSFSRKHSQLRQRFGLKHRIETPKRFPEAATKRHLRLMQTITRLFRFALRRIWVSQAQRKKFSPLRMSPPKRKRSFCACTKETFPIGILPQWLAWVVSFTTSSKRFARNWGSSSSRKKARMKARHCDDCP